MKDYEVFRQWLGNVMDFIYGPSHNWPFKALEKQKEWKEPKNHDFSYPVTDYVKTNQNEQELKKVDIKQMINLHLILMKLGLVVKHLKRKKVKSNE